MTPTATTRWQPPPPPRAAMPSGPLAPLVAASAIGGLALDVGIRGGPTNAAMTVGLLTVIGLVLAQPDLSTHARAAAGAAALPALFLSIWASPWLAAVNLLAVGGLVVMAVALSHTGTLFDLSLWRLAVRSVHAGLRGLGRVPGLARPVPLPRGERAGTLLRTGGAVVLALPLLAALVALLASADAVFAGLIVPDVDLGPVVGHVVMTALFAIGVLTVALAVGTDVEERDSHGPFGSSEIAVVLGLAAVVLAMFVVSQLVALTDAGQRLIDQAGLTPAEYARSGFFQLCWAATVVVAYLALVRRLAAGEALAARKVRWLSAVVPVLALGLVGVSLRRMALYDQAFGLTMLRLAVVGAILWIGVLLLAMAARNAGFAGERRWVLGAAVVAAFCLVVVANLTNPEGFVVTHNVARASQGAEVDAAYLAELSDDAVPAIAAAIERTPEPDLRRRLQAALDCDPRSGVERLNVSRARAATELAISGGCP